MNIVASIDGLLATGLQHPLLMPAVIVLGTFILEDATTLLIGIWAAAGSISAETALLSLYLGIVLGDFGLYGLGRLGALPSRANRIANHERLAPFKNWLEGQLMLAIFSARFMPGLRLPTYTATGFFEMPFRRFAVSVVLATLVWTTLLFGAAFLFGSATAELLGAWRWLGALVPIVILFVIGRVRARRAFELPVGRS